MGELAAPTSARLLVRRPIGDGVIEFVRAEGANGNGKHPSGAAARTRSRSGSRSRSRSRSRSAKPDRSGGIGNFLPGDWNCPKCGEHNFARNLLCRSCNTPKPPKDDSSTGLTGREAFVAKVKNHQRQSHGFKMRWYEYCDKFGRGFYDPARHEVRFLEDFFEAEKRR